MPVTLHVAGQSDPDEPAARPLARLRRAQPRVIGDLERAVEGTHIVTAVVDHPRRVAERERGRRRIVAAADLGRIDPEPLGRHVHEPLDYERRLLHAEGAVGAARRAPRPRSAP